MSIHQNPYFTVLSRLLTATIFGFWICMTGILLRSIWFPADSRLTEVNPGAVFQLIAARGEGSALDIYEGRRIVGNLSVLALPGKRLGQQNVTNLKLNGQLDLNSPLLPGTRLDLNCQLDLDRDGNVLSSLLTLSTSKPNLKLVLGQTSPDAALSVLLEKDARVLVDSTLGGHGNTQANPMIALLLGSLGMSYADFNAVQAEAEGKAASMRIEARQGEFELGSTTRQGFVLKIGSPGKPGFRMCVDNTGEIVLLETPVSYHLMTESLRPETPPTR